MVSTSNIIIEETLYRLDGNGDYQEYVPESSVRLALVPKFEGESPPPPETIPARKIDAGGVNIFISNHKLRDTSNREDPNKVDIAILYLCTGVLMVASILLPSVAKAIKKGA